ncbi:MAG: tyrosine-type recombinase/integrase [Bryobacteraceae bacterium]
MPNWPDQDETLINQFVSQLNLAYYSAPYRSLLRQFQSFVAQRSPRSTFSEAVLCAWLKDELKTSPLPLVVHRGQLVNRFLDWLAARGAIAANPIAVLRHEYKCRSSATVLRALVGAEPAKALESLRPAPRYGSHLGPIMREHVNRMRTRGLRYRHENRFLQFDRFLQQRPNADREPLTTLIREYAAFASSAAGKVQRIQLGRVIAKELNRSGLAVAPPKRDRVLVQEMLRNRRRPHIYTTEEVRRLMDVARRDLAPRAPLRSLTLYTMLVLAYCAGLRLGEVVGLKLGDVDLNTDCIDVRDTKFFKSRRLPLSATAMAALRDYLKARVKAGAPTESDAPLFWHAKGGYGYVATGAHLRRLIRVAGLKKTSGRTGPRVHDLRHAFVVHRMTMWYEQGINPQTRLPYLAAYLGHRNIHSTLVYLTITQELLQHANERFRASEAEVLQVIRRSH